MSSKKHPANRRQPAQPRREIRPTPTKSASGIPYWPARDPIGERGGVNLYGFVGNDGINRLDVLGHTTDFGILENDGSVVSVLNHAVNTWENINPLGFFHGQGADYFMDIKYLGVNATVISGGSDGNLVEQKPELFSRVCAIEVGGVVPVDAKVAGWFSHKLGLTVGHIDLNVIGNLTKTCPKGRAGWSFSGSISAKPDLFDFNQMEREGVTADFDFGMAVADILQTLTSRKFYIKPTGSVRIEESGRCS